MWPVSCDFSLNTSCRLDVVSELAEGIASPNASAENRAIQPTAVATQRRWMADEQNFPKFLHHKQHYDLRTPVDVEPAIAHLTRMLEQKIFPMLFACETLDGVDEALNPVPPKKAILEGLGGNYTSIIAAYLARNPRLEEIIAAILPGTLRCNEGLPRCIAYVQEQLASKSQDRPPSNGGQAEHGESVQ